MTQTINWFINASPGQFAFGLICIAIVVKAIYYIIKDL